MSGRNRVHPPPSFLLYVFSISTWVLDVLTPSRCASHDRHPLSYPSLNQTPIRTLNQIPKIRPPRPTKVRGRQPHRWARTLLRIRGYHQSNNHQRRRLPVNQNLSVRTLTHHQPGLQRNRSGPYQVATKTARQKDDGVWLS